MSENQNSEQPWYGDRWKGNETLSRFKSLDAFIESALETKSKVGRSVEIPSEITPETIAPVLKRLGLPSDASAYKLPDDPVAKEFASAFLEAGLLPFQAEKLVGKITSVAESQKAKAREAIEKINAEVEKEWGDKAGEYKERLERFSANKDSLEYKAYEKLSEVDPRLAKNLALKIIGEPRKESKGVPSTPVSTKDEAKAKIEEIRKEARESNGAHWWFNPNEEQQAYKSKLYELASS